MSPDTAATTVESSDIIELEIGFSSSGHFAILGSNRPLVHICSVVLSSTQATINSSPCLKSCLFGEITARVPPSPLYVQCPGLGWGHLDFTFLFSVWVMGLGQLGTVKFP